MPEFLHICRKSRVVIVALTTMLAGVPTANAQYDFADLSAALDQLNADLKKAHPVVCSLIGFGLEDDMPLSEWDLSEQAMFKFQYCYETTMTVDAACELEISSYLVLTQIHDRQDEDSYISTTRSLSQVNIPDISNVVLEWGEVGDRYFLTEPIKVDLKNRTLEHANIAEVGTAGPESREALISMRVNGQIKFRETSDVSNWEIKGNKWRKGGRSELYIDEERRNKGFGEDGGYSSRDFNFEDTGEVVSTRSPDLRGFEKTEEYKPIFIFAPQDARAVYSSFSTYWAICNSN